jgi:molecular chaperone HscB
MQMTTHVNEAYRTLKSPVRRAQYLLELNGIDAGFETNTAMPPEFLMQQMEIRERLEEARNASTLDLLRQDLDVQAKELESRIGEEIDGRHDYAAARDLVRKLMFVERFGEDIDAAYEALEA